MKKFLLLICITVIATGLSAQINTETPERQDRQDRQVRSDQNYHDQGDSTQVELKDGYIIRDGRMMSVENGRTSAMKKETTLGNGTIVAVNGNYTTKNGKPIMLKDGEHMDMNGNITKHQAQRGSMRD